MCRDSCSFCDIGCYEVTCTNTTCVVCRVSRSTSMMEGTGSLEQQLATLRQRAGEVRARRADLRRLEELGESAICVIVRIRVTEKQATDHFFKPDQSQGGELERRGRRMFFKRS